MAQIPTTRRSNGNAIDYTPVAAVTAGDVVTIDDFAFVAEHDIEAGELGALACEGIFRVPKWATAGAYQAVFAAGDPVYWETSGVPAGLALTGANQVGAATADSGTSSYFMGWAVAAAAAGDHYVDVKLSQQFAVVT